MPGGECIKLIWTYIRSQRAVGPHTLFARAVFALALPTFKKLALLVLKRCNARLEIGHSRASLSLVHSHKQPGLTMTTDPPTSSDDAWRSRVHVMPTWPGWPQRPAHKNRVAFLPVAEGGEAILSGRLSIYRDTCSTSWRACP